MFWKTIYYYINNWFISMKKGLMVKDILKVGKLSDLRKNVFNINENQTYPPVFLALQNTKKVLKDK